MAIDGIIGKDEMSHKNSFLVELVRRYYIYMEQMDTFRRIGEYHLYAIGKAPTVFLNKYRSILSHKKLSEKNIKETSIEYFGSNEIAGKN